MMIYTNTLVDDETMTQVMGCCVQCADVLV